MLEWTNKRWIITLSKSGDKNKKERVIRILKKLLIIAKKTQIYKKILNTFSDAELIDIEKKMNDFSKILDKAKELEEKMKESQQKLKKFLLRECLEQVQ